MVCVSTLFKLGFRLGAVHLTIGSSNDDNGTIHVGSTSDHVLNVISVTRAVDVSVVTVLSCELNVGSGDGNTTLALLRGLINGGIVEEVGKALRGLVLGDGGSQGSLWEDGVNFHVRRADMSE